MAVLTDRELAAWRLRTQWLTAPGPDAVSVVGHLLGVQAENPRQSEWAVAARTTTPTADAVPSALASGAVVRTHVLRPTWHYALAEDVGWLLDLTAPTVRRTVLGALERHGVDADELARIRAAVVAALEASDELTRPELVAVLAESRIVLDSITMSQALLAIELDQVMCSGAPRDGEHTYALSERRLLQPRRLERDEALAEIAWRYVAGHGPATERDLAYWASLGLRDVRRGLAAAGDRLASFEQHGRLYWHAAYDEPPRAGGEPRGHLLLALDEMHNGFQESRYAIDEAGLVPRATRYPAVGMALVDTQFVACHTRTVTPAGVRFDLVGWRGLGDDDLAVLTDAASRVGDYLGVPASVRVA